MSIGRTGGPSGPQGPSTPGQLEPSGQMPNGQRVTDLTNAVAGKKASGEVKQGQPVPKGLPAEAAKLFAAALMTLFCLPIIVALGGPLGAVFALGMVSGLASQAPKAITSSLSSALNSPTTQQAAQQIASGVGKWIGEAVSKEKNPSSTLDDIWHKLKIPGDNPEEQKKNLAIAQGETADPKAQMAMLSAIKEKEGNEVFRPRINQLLAQRFGYAESQLELGKQLIEKQGSRAAGRLLIKKSSEQGNVDALLEMGGLSLSGKGALSKDEKAAVQSFTRVLEAEPPEENPETLGDDVDAKPKSKEQEKAEKDKKDALLKLKEEAAKELESIAENRNPGYEEIFMTLARYQMTQANEAKKAKDDKKRENFSDKAIKSLNKLPTEGKFSGESLYKVAREFLNIGDSKNYQLNLQLSAKRGYPQAKEELELLPKEVAPAAPTEAAPSAKSDQDNKVEKKPVEGQEGVNAPQKPNEKRLEAEGILDDPDLNPSTVEK